MARASYTVSRPELTAYSLSLRPFNYLTMAQPPDDLIPWHADHVRRALFGVHLATSLQHMHC